MKNPVAVIDVGSNSIKVLVAAEAPGGGLVSLYWRAIEARISRGISQGSPVLGEEGMSAALGAIATLHADALSHGAGTIQIVATSAVRDAGNGALFASRVLSATGTPLRILSGKEEARLIGAGLLSDPALQNLGRFNVFDLGGGSMECLAFSGRTLLHSQSLQLGCVRLTELFVRDPAQPLSSVEAEEIRKHVGKALGESGFPLDRELAPGFVVSGGSMTTVRAILGAAQGLQAAQGPSAVSLAELEALSTSLCSMTLEERRKGVPGLAQERADVFPAALVTILTVAHAAGAREVRHSFHNLRYGLAAEMLEATAQ